MSRVPLSVYIYIEKYKPDSSPLIIILYTRIKRLINLCEHKKNIEERVGAPANFLNPRRRDVRTGRTAPVVSRCLFTGRCSGGGDGTSLWPGCKSIFIWIIIFCRRALNTLTIRIKKKPKKTRTRRLVAKTDTGTLIDAIGWGGGGDPNCIRFFFFFLYFRQTPPREVARRLGSRVSVVVTGPRTIFSKKRDTRLVLNLIVTFYGAEVASPERQRRRRRKRQNERWSAWAPKDPRVSHYNYNYYTNKNDCGKKIFPTFRALTRSSRSRTPRRPALVNV